MARRACLTGSVDHLEGPGRGCFSCHWKRPLENHSTLLGLVFLQNVCLDISAPNPTKGNLTCCTGKQAKGKLAGIQQHAPPQTSPYSEPGNMGAPVLIDRGRRPSSTWAGQTGQQASRPAGRRVTPPGGQASLLGHVRRHWSRLLRVTSRGFYFSLSGCPYSSDVHWTTHPAPQVGVVRPPRACPGH